VRLPRNSGFVTTNGTAFVLNGQAFRVAGANNYYLGYAPDSMAAAVFDLADQMNFNVLRTWAFLDCGAAEPGCTPANAKDGIFFHYWDSATGSPAFNDGPNGLERLDRTIALAEQHGIRLILPLVNYWDDFGGVNQYLSWFGLRGRDRFYRNSDVKDAYRAYLEHLALRVNTRTGRCYRDEPAILAWELANEPRCVADDGSPLPDGTGTLIDWVHEMSTWLKSIDPNHLVAVGDEGCFRCERLLQVPDIDFGTCHLYPDYAAQGDPIAFGVRCVARPRPRTLNQSRTTRAPVGNCGASPRPRIARPNTNWSKLAQRPVSPWASDHSRMPAPSRRRGPKRSTSAPAGSWAKA
jgi:endo-1,4-beta-mannosidase